MIPRGPIYEALRSQMIDSFPEGSKALYGGFSTIGDWFGKGSIVVKASEKRRVTFQAPQVEFGSTLLMEIENLFNHCFEHLQELGCLVDDSRTRSHAWSTVTAYYLAFFSASTLLRLLGRPVVFMSREQLSVFPILLGSGLAPTQGTYEITKTRAVSATHAEFSMKAATSRVHKATWIKLLGYLDELRRLHANTNASEAQFYDSLCTSILFPQYVNFQWPSLVRSRANYHPGFAYKLDTGRPNSGKLIQEWATMEPEEVIQRLSKTTRDCYSDSQDFKHHVSLMISIGISLFLLARELYSELLVRKSLDKRWEDKRRLYRKKMVFAASADRTVAKTF
jgi:hypothetical protein